MARDKRLGHWEVGPNRILLWDPTGKNPVEPPTVPGAHVFLICLDPIVAHRAEIEARKAGLEIRDTMVWFRGQQPPVTVVVGRKPLEGTVAPNVLKYGTGALNVDACRIPTAEGEGSPSTQRRGAAAKSGKMGRLGGLDGPSKGKFQTGADRKKSLEIYTEERPSASLGRWPANVLHDGSAEVSDRFPKTCKSSGKRLGNASKLSYGFLNGSSLPVGFGDTGSAARFFHTIPDLDALVAHLTALVATSDTHKGGPDADAPETR